MPRERAGFKGARIGAMRAFLIAWLAIVACDKQGETVRPEDTPELTDEDKELSDPEPDEQKPAIDTTTKVEGGLTEDQVKATIDAQFQPVRECFDEALARMQAQNLIGAIVVEFSVGAGGKVENAAVAASDFGDAEAGECIVAKLETWTFPKPKKGQAKVRWPFHLRSY
jgi:hypothetical protein